MKNEVVPIFTTGGQYVSRIIPREGITPVYVCLYKSVARILRTKKDIVTFCQLTKGIPSRSAFDEWWDTHCMDDFPEVVFNIEDIKKTGWGPEAHDNTELDTPLKKGQESKTETTASPTATSSVESFEEQDPTKHTKMVM